MNLNRHFRILLLVLIFLCPHPDHDALAGKFDPPRDRELSLRKKPLGEKLLSLMKIDPEAPDYAGRRFTSGNDFGSHYTLVSHLFREGFALYKIPSIDTNRIKIQGHRPIKIRRIYLGKDRGKFLPPELLKEIKTLNDLVGFIHVKNKKDAIEYVRLGSSALTGRYFELWPEELFCVSEVQPLSNGQTMTFEECAQLGFGEPEVRKIKKEKVRIESDKTTRRFKMRADSPKEEEDDGDDEDVDTDVKSYLITRNVSVDTGPEIGFYRQTEEVGPNGEWRIVDKKRVNLLEVKKRPRNNQKR